ncbi:MAG: hypothetical protein HOO67_06465 [Candidatus Peribacteraceae bacterium]|nr:hypothetical protein [Candidatus Peribacteraceae bacterium]
MRPDHAPPVRIPDQHGSTILEAPSKESGAGRTVTTGRDDASDQLKELVQITDDLEQNDPYKVVSAQKKQRKRDTGKQKISIPSDAAEYAKLEEMMDKLPGRMERKFPFDLTEKRKIIRYFELYRIGSKGNVVKKMLAYGFTPVDLDKWKVQCGITTASAVPKPALPSTLNDEAPSETHASKKPTVAGTQKVTATKITTTMNAVDDDRVSTDTMRDEKKPAKAPRQTPRYVQPKIPSDLGEIDVTGKPELEKLVDQLDAFYGEMGIRTDTTRKGLILLARLLGTNGKEQVCARYEIHEERWVKIQASFGNLSDEDLLPLICREAEKDAPRADASLIPAGTIKTGTAAHTGTPKKRIAKPTVSDIPEVEWNDADRLSEVMNVLDEWNEMNGFKGRWSDQARKGLCLAARLLSVVESIPLEQAKENVCTRYELNAERFAGAWNAFADLANEELLPQKCRTNPGNE